MSALEWMKALEKKVTEMEATNTQLNETNTSLSEIDEWLIDEGAVKNGSIEIFNELLTQSHQEWHNIKRNWNKENKKMISYHWNFLNGLMRKEKF